MKIQILAIAAVMMTSAFASFAQARGSSSGVMLTANAYMYNQTTEAGGTKSESKSSIYDIKLGYLGGGGLYLGGLYTLRNSEAGNTSQDGSAMGASIGYIGASGFFVKGHYILSAKYGDNLKEGTGLQGDFGYITSVSSNVLVGVELTYRSIEYKEDGGAKTKVDELFPMLTVGFVF